MILELDNVELYFNNKRILNGIYLKAETGRITGILGSNGCGKTSVLEILFGNIRPKYKLIRLNKTPVLKPLYLLNTIKYLPQYFFLPRLKLKTIFKIFDVDWNNFILLFEDFKNYKNLKINKLSGGEQRIIEVYLILKSKSKIVLLDEPFSHLAPLQIEKIKTILAEEKADKAIIITDHLYPYIIETADDIYLLKNGCSKKINHLRELEDYKYLSVGSVT